MKKSSLIICAVLATFSLAAIGFIGSKNEIVSPPKKMSAKASTLDKFLSERKCRKPIPDLHYSIDSRFMTQVTKDQLQRARTILDILPPKATNDLFAYQNVRLTLMGPDGEITSRNSSELLTDDQHELIKKMDYSSNFHIRADCNQGIKGTEAFEPYDLVYYMTVVPEREAQYEKGNDALIKYLKTNSLTSTSIIERDNLKPGRVFFVIDKNGEVAKVSLESSCGYPSVDATMTGLINNMPGKWIPATNSKGLKVDQQLVFFFGLLGC